MILSGMAYSPKQGLVLGVICLALVGYMLLRGFRTGTFPRARPLVGKLPPEMGTVISRDKNPRQFWTNVWCGIVMIVICVVGITLSILEMIFPQN